MVKKPEFVKRLLVEVDVRGSYPKRRKDDFSLLEEGVKAILMRHIPEGKAETSVISLRSGFVDWNEARVSQAQEIASHLRTGSRGGKVERLEECRAAAVDVKIFLQEIFQKTHGLDLETSCEDMVEASKALTDLPTMGQTIGGYLLYHAVEGDIPVHKGMMKLCQKLGIMESTSSLAKGFEMITPLVPKGKEREFVLAIHEVADRWDDSSNPIYMQCEILRTCVYGQKAYTSRVALLKRLEAKAEREEKKRVARELREQAQREHEEEKAERERQRVEAAEAREAKRIEALRERKELQEKRAAEAVAKAKQRELDAKKKVEEKKKAEAKRKAEAKKRVEAKKRAAAKKKADAKKRAIAKKKAAVKKRADAKKAEAKKEADAKKAEAKKEADAKKAEAKKEADAKKAAEAKKKADAKKAAEAKKKADAKKAAEAKKKADAKKAAEAKKKADAKKKTTKKPAATKKVMKI